MLIAIIEDEEDLLELLEFHLIKEGFDVVGFLNPKNIKKFLEEENPDLLIVDRNIPFIEGTKLIKKLRKEGYNIPVIFLTAKNSEDDIIEGFEAGADDYIKKPFSMRELIARVKAVIKRYNPSSNLLSYKEYKLDISSMQLITKTKKIDLTNSETSLLKLFFNNPNTILSKDLISQELKISTSSVNVAINRLNHKIELIKAIRGVGYKLK